MSFGEYFSALSSLGKTYADGVKEFDQRNALSALGQQVQSGDYPGAVKTAFDAGDAATGLKLLALGQAARKDQLGLDATREFASGFGLGGPQAKAAPANGLDAVGSGRGVPSFLDTDGPAGSYLPRLFTRESNNSDTAQASTSSARGAAQFVKGTWNQVAAQHPDLGLVPVGDGQDGRTDRAQMIRATQALTADNEGLLRQSNLPVNDATRYSLHLLGAGGGRRFLGGALSNPDAPAINYVDPKQVAANRSIFYGRDGAPKSAGQVLQDFGRSFGMGGGAPSARQAGGNPGLPPGASGLNPDARPQPQRQPVQFADTEADVQRLEQGMMPRQSAGLDPQADMPAPGMVPAEFRIPPGSTQTATGLTPGLSGDGSGGARPLPSSDPNGRNAPAVPTLGGDPGGRTMQIPGQELPAPRAPAAPIAPNTMVGGVPAAAIMGASTTQKMQAAERALLNPYTPDHVRDFANQVLKNAWDETKAPEAVKEFRIARANGWTQARTPVEYAAEAAAAKRGPTVVGAGSSMYGPDGNLIATAPDRDRDEGAKVAAQVRAREQEGVRLGMQPGSPELRDYALGARPERQTEASKISGGIEARRTAAASLGLEPGTPAWRSYVGAGKIGADRDMSAGEKKSIEAADTMALGAQQSIGMLEQAKALSAKAYAGPMAALRGKGTAFLGSEAGQATLELDNLVTTNALAQLKSIFGAAPTEGERKILLDIQGSSSLPHPLRVKIYDRAIQAAELRMQQNEGKADAIREGRYFRQGGGAAVRGNPAGSGDVGGTRALPAPSPSNRPGAVSAGDRFGQLVGSGMSKAQAYQQLHQEGY